MNQPPRPAAPPQAYPPNYGPPAGYPGYPPVPPPAFHFESEPSDSTRRAIRPPDRRHLLIDWFLHASAVTFGVVLGGIILMVIVYQYVSWRASKAYEEFKGELKNRPAFTSPSAR